MGTLSHLESPVKAESHSETAGFSCNFTSQLCEEPVKNYITAHTTLLPLPIHLLKKLRLLLSPCIGSRFGPHSSLTSSWSAVDCVDRCQCGMEDASLRFSSIPAGTHLRNKIAFPLRNQKRSNLAMYNALHNQLRLQKADSLTL